MKGFAIWQLPLPQVGIFYVLKDSPLLLAYLQMTCIRCDSKTRQVVLEIKTSGLK